ncbi:hypothetical protein Goshw_008905, partial [Gossypium schwendimanii]|nr:hypothetical protein [Gossypium schwendimanii]
MEAVLTLAKPRSWKECLVGTRLRVEGKAVTMDSFDDDEDFELLDVDAVRSLVNGIPSINFFERTFRLMHIENDYCLTKIQNPKDFE